MIAPASTIRTVAEVLAPMFSLGELPRVVRLRRAWARWSAGEVFSWSDASRGFLSPDGRHVVRADTVRSAPHIFAAQPVQMELAS